MSKICKVGGQAVMEGVMMKSPDGIAVAVRKPDGTIATQYKPMRSRAQKGTILGFPVIRGVVAFVESLSIGMKTLTDSAKLAGEEIDEEPTKFEKWLSDKLGKSVESIVIALAVVIAVAMSIGLFFVLPTLVSSLFFGTDDAAAQTAGIWKSLTEGAVRLVIFIGYILFCASVKDVRRVFMYHGAEHKTIACYEAEEELTPENAMKHSRLHPRCGTNYLFLVMAVSILFFAAIGWNANFFVRLATRIVFLPVVAGLSYEVLQFAARHDNLLTKIIRAPGMGLQYITTKEPTPDMIEVAIASFNLAMDPSAYLDANEKPQNFAFADASSITVPASECAASECAASEDAASEDAASEDAASEDAASEDAASEGAAPEGAASEDAGAK